MGNSNSQYIEKVSIIAYAYNQSEDTIKSCITDTANKLNVNESVVIDNIIGDADNIISSKITGNFVYKDYDINVDDQHEITVGFSEQEYMNRDFTKLLRFRFPTLDENSEIPATFKYQRWWDINKSITDRLQSLRESNWTNQTLSYTRDSAIAKHIINCIIEPLYSKGLFGNVPITIIDATANIGGDAIAFALEKFIGKVIAYEISESTYEMLRNNIRLYGLENKIDSKNIRFDYNVPEDSLVIIDPPYESAYNENFKSFNLSIDSTPIYNVAKMCLDKGAKCVLLTMPKTYRYNAKFAIINHQNVTSYQMGTKNNKIFAVMRSDDGDKLKLHNFSSYKVVQSGALTKQGKVNPFKCKKIEDL